MKKHKLEAKPRTVVGRKVKRLRTQGIVPATLYGKTTEAISIELPLDTFLHTFKQTGETGLIDLTIDGNSHPVLVKQVQFHPVTGIPLHVEFHEVNLKEKIKANVPVVLTGESQAVKEGMGTLLHLLDEIEVEALPTDLPERVEFDITNLIKVNDQIMVKEWAVPTGVTVLTDPELIVVKIGQLTAPEPEPVVELAPAEGEAAVTGEGDEEAKEGEQKEGTPEEPKEKPAKEKPAEEAK